MVSPSTMRGTPSNTSAAVVAGAAITARAVQIAPALNKDCWRR